MKATTSNTGRIRPAAERRQASNAAFCGILPPQRGLSCFQPEPTANAVGYHLSVLRTLEGPFVVGCHRKHSFESLTHG
jgi:hypothetical protein